jgi:hypothetical protein
MIRHAVLQISQSRRAVDERERPVGTGLSCYCSHSFQLASHRPYKATTLPSYNLEMAAHPPSRPLSSTSQQQPYSSLSTTRSFRPYYPPTTLQHLIRLQSAAHSSRSTAPLRDSNGQRKELSEATVEGWRQLACGYIERVGSRLGLYVHSSFCFCSAQVVAHHFAPNRQQPSKDHRYGSAALPPLSLALPA